MNGTGCHGKLQVLAQKRLREAAESAAYLSLEEQCKGWFAKLPKAAGDLWKWCLEQNQGTISAAGDQEAGCSLDGESDGRIEQGSAQ
ncbi:MAG TPA: hypothetical protein VF283_17485 [Bryobacteraceae bacterium]